MSDPTSDPETLGYTPDHEWVRIDGSIATVGITSFAAAKLGDIVYVDLPAVGSALTAGSVVGEIESTKSVGELFAPVEGTVIETNESVTASPELVNSDPFGEGWLIRIEFTTAPELLDHDAYRVLTGE